MITSKFSKLARITAIMGSVAIFSAGNAMAFDNKATQLKEKKTDDGTFVVFKNVVVAGQDSMFVDVPQTFSSGAKEVSLVQTGSGGNGCPAEYYFVMIEGNTVNVSESIGNCSDIPKITNTNDGQKISLSFPKFNSAPKVSYTYENGVIKENNKKVLKWTTKTAK